jgi:hypothetical protein
MIDIAHSIFSESIAWVLSGLVILGILATLWQRAKRKRAWITEARKIGLVYFNEDGKRGTGGGTATSSEVEHIKSFSNIRALQRGYHVHVLTGKWEGRDVLVTDYKAQKFPKDLQTELQHRSANSTYPRTVYATRLKKGSLPALLLCRNRQYADNLDWIKDDELVDFPDDTAFSNAFTVASSAGEAVKEVLTQQLRTTLLNTVPGEFHLEMNGRDIAIHFGRNTSAEKTREQLALLSEIVALLPPA